jgi:hypothetical protein
MKITAAQKHAIAADYIAGLSVLAICEKHHITAGGFRRLRREDPVYQEIEEELLDELLEQSRLALRNKAQQAIETLTSILELDRKNLATRTGPNGGEIQERSVDVKLLGEQRLTASALLSFWLRLEDAQRAQANWRASNLIEVGEEDNEEELTSDDD